MTENGWYEVIIRSRNQLMVQTSQSAFSVWQSIAECCTVLGTSRMRTAMHPWADGNIAGGRWSHRPMLLKAVMDRCWNRSCQAMSMEHRFSVIQCCPCVSSRWHIWLQSDYWTSQQLSCLSDKGKHWLFFKRKHFTYRICVYKRNK